jgi:quinoprotein glucose dehydrogenase
LKQINKSNVKQLEVAWTYPTGPTNRFNPIVIDGTMYVSSTNQVVALDAATGKEIWKHPGGAPARGINYWESKDRKDQRLIMISGGLTELNAKTGEVITTFGTDGKVNIGPGLDPAEDRTTQNATANPGKVVGDVIVIPLPAGGASYEAIPGDVHGYDVLTGKLLWVFHSVPHPGETGYNTWPPDLYKSAGGVHNWSEMSADEERGIAYVPFGTARYDFYGGNRPGDNLFGNSLVALDVKNRKIEVVLPDGPSRSVGLRSAHCTKTSDGAAQRTRRRCRRPANEARVPVCVRSRGRERHCGRLKNERCHSRMCRVNTPRRRSLFPTLPPPFARQSFTENDVNPYLPMEEQTASSSSCANRETKDYSPRPACRERFRCREIMAAPIGAVLLWIPPKAPCTYSRRKHRWAFFSPAPGGTK